MFYLRKGQLPIFFVNLFYLLIFLFVFSSRRNYEFLSYIGVVVFFSVVILMTNKKVKYPNSVLWGLTLWGAMHMSGGGILLNAGTMRLYELILIPLSEEYGIFRYDQLVHIIGFGVSTLLMFSLLKPKLKEMKGFSLWLVIVMAGLGVGAMNEIIEFSVTIFVKNTGVGDFTNTSLDLIADLLGGILAAIWIKRKKGNI